MIDFQRLPKRKRNGIYLERERKNRFIEREREKGEDGSICSGEKRRVKKNGK